MLLCRRVLSLLFVICWLLSALLQLHVSLAQHNELKVFLKQPKTIILSNIIFTVHGGGLNQRFHGMGRHCGFLALENFSCIAQHQKPTVHILAIVPLSNYSLQITPAIPVSFKITNNRLMKTINGNKSVYFIDSLIHIAQSEYRYSYVYLTMI